VLERVKETLDSGSTTTHALLELGRSWAVHAAGTGS
jgi:hypothetical protein